jgi:hypothetical protein
LAGTKVIAARRQALLLKHGDKLPPHLHHDHGRKKEQHHDQEERSASVT